MKPPGSISLRHPSCGRRLPAAAARRTALLPLLGRLVSLLLLLHGSSCPRPLAAAAAADLHWNETAGSIEGLLADEENIFQQNKSSNSKNNSYSNAIQKEITLPSRLIYYINRDSETPYHILDTRARHQQKHDKAVHLAQASFQIEAFGSKFILDLTLNKQMDFLFAEEII